MTEMQIRNEVNKEIQNNRLLRLSIKSKLNISITELERIVILGIVENEYTENNGAIVESYDECDAVWTDCLTSNSIEGFPNDKVLSGVISSLTKKGLTSSDTGRDASTWITEKCFEVYKILRNL